MSTFEAAILDPGILQRACARAMAGDGPSADTAARKADLLKRQATLLQELRRLTDPLADGDSSRALRQGITTREAEAAQLDRALARIARANAPAHTPAAVAEQLEVLLPEWRASLRQHAPQVRQILRMLLHGRVVLTPEVRHEQPGYRVRGATTVEPFLNVVLRGEKEKEGSAQAMASPARNPDLCSPLDVWFPRVA